MRSNFMQPKMIRPDAKGRITLGHLADGISGFIIVEATEHRIVLEPYTEIPASERWLFENKKALKMLKEGLKAASEGRLVDKGSFAKFADDEAD